MNFIVDVVEEDNQETDHGKLEEALDRLESNDLTPNTVYADQGYISGETIATCREDGVEAFGPIENRDKGINDRFEYDSQTDQYICPEGKVSRSSKREKDGSTIYRFAPSDCANCPLQRKCRPKVNSKNKKDGRIIRRAKHHEEIVERRELMRTDEYKLEMKNRNAIEGTISALKRGYGFSRSRYRGKQKFALQMIFSAISFNIKRLEFALAAA